MHGEQSSVIIGYILGFAKSIIPASARPTMTSLFDNVTDLAERAAGLGGDLTPPLRIRLHIGPLADPRIYRDTGKRDVEAFRTIWGLKPGAQFLDVGCGCGRVAVPLTGFLDETATYEGLDTARGPVRWCQKRISSRFPNFHFTATDTFSGRYNPSAEASAARLAFPYEADRFDLVFGGSVYIHMLPEEVRNFLAETARVLKPGGTAISTFCLLNDRSMPSVRAGEAALRLPHDYGECRVSNVSDPTRFIAQPESMIRRFYSEAGLSIVEPIRYGNWARPSPEVNPFQEDFFSQDVIVASKER